LRDQTVSQDLGAAFGVSRWQPKFSLIAGRVLSSVLQEGKIPKKDCSDQEIPRIALIEHQKFSSTSSILFGSL